MHFGRVEPNYLPFIGGGFRLSMGLTPIPERAWLEPGSKLAAELAAKRNLLAARHDEVFCALPEAAAPSAELLQLIASHLSHHHPSAFRLAGDRLANLVTGENWNLAQPALHPLDIAARLVPEDLCLLQSVGDRYRLIGASLCSPARWLLAEKIGRPITAIHDAVPGYAESLVRPVDQFFATLKPHRLVCRFNWGIADDPAPFQPVAPALTIEATAENAGENLWLRVERQTLRKLPESGAVVFTIRTYITRLDEAIQSTASARDLAAAIRAMPPDMQRYKRIAPYETALLAWLDRRAGDQRFGKGS